MSGDLFRVIALLGARTSIANFLCRQEQAAFAVATTSSMRGRGEAGDRVKVMASLGAVEVCSRSWMWEVVPWYAGMWTKATPWERPAAKHAEWIEVASGGLDMRWGHSMVAVPNEEAEVGYTLLVVGGSRSRTPMFTNVCTSDDGGATWRILDADVRFRVCMLHAMVVVPRVDGRGHDIVLTGGESGLNHQGVECRGGYGDAWRSKDIGVTWRKTTWRMECGNRSGHAMCVMPGAHPEILLVGGMNDDGYMRDGWTSTDLGRRWSRVCAEVMEDARRVPGLVCVPNPGGCRVVLICKHRDGSVVRTSVDRGRSWETVMTEGPRIDIDVLYSNPVSVLPRMGGGGDIVLVSKTYVGGAIWLCEGEEWRQLDEGEERLGDPLMVGSAAVVVPCRDGEWEVITSGGCRGSHLSSNVMRAKLC